MKKEKKLLIIIFVLALLLVVSVGYICYSKFNPTCVEVDASELSGDDEYEDLEEERDLTFDELSVLTAKIDLYNDGFANYYPIDDMSKIKNSDLFLFSVLKARKGTLQEFDGKLMDEYLKNFFGNSVKLVHEDYNCSADNKLLYKYNSKTNSYSYETDGHWHGGSQRAYLPDISTKISFSEYKDGIYTVYATVLYSNTCSDTCGPISSYYKSYEDSLNHKNPVITEVSEYMTEESKDYYRANLPITTYKFKRDNTGNMILISVEIK